MIAGAVLSLAHWLLQCYHHALQAGNADTFPDMLTKPANILDLILSRDFTTAMLYLAKHEHKELYVEVANKCQVLSQAPSFPSTSAMKNYLL